MVEQSYGLMAGLNIRIWGFLQDLAQLQHSYPAWETFWSNSSIIQILNCGDLNTSEHISKYLGTATVNSKTGGQSYKMIPYPEGSGGYMAQVSRYFVRWLVDQKGYSEERARKNAEVITSVPCLGQVEPLRPGSAQNISDFKYQDGSVIPWLVRSHFDYLLDGSPRQ